MRHRHWIGTAGLAVLTFSLGVWAAETQRLEPPRCKDYVELSEREQALYVHGYLESYEANRAILVGLVQNFEKDPKAGEEFRKGSRALVNAFGQLTQRRPLGSPSDARQLLSAVCFEPKRSLRRASLAMRDLMMNVE